MPELRSAELIEQGGRVFSLIIKLPGGGFVEVDEADDTYLLQVVDLIRFEAGSRGLDVMNPEPPLSLGSAQTTAGA